MPDSLQPHGLYSLPDSSVHGILQARLLEWVAISSSRGSSWPRDPALQDSQSEKISILSLLIASLSQMLYICMYNKKITIIIVRDCSGFFFWRQGKCYKTLRSCLKWEVRDNFSWSYEFSGIPKFHMGTVGEKITVHVLRNLYHSLELCDATWATWLLQRSSPASTTLQDTGNGWKKFCLLHDRVKMFLCSISL